MRVLVTRLKGILVLSVRDVTQSSGDIHIISPNGDIIAVLPESFDAQGHATRIVEAMQKHYEEFHSDRYKRAYRESSKR